MKHQAFTLGLPRSRSLWLSFLLQQHGAWAVHEWVSRGFEMPSKEVMEQADQRLFISCDTNPMAEYPWGLDTWPLVIVERPFEDVLRSLRANFDWPRGFPVKDKLEEMNEQLNAIRRMRADALVVPFEELSSPASVAAMMFHLGFDLVNKALIEYLIDCRISVVNRDPYETYARDWLPARGDEENEA